ncbi:MAG: hypothetical protein QNJ16_00800 [Rhodobacter sp.]|nr:hypothetical protein [Rhodobacter sp.]
MAIAKPMICGAMNGRTARRIAMKPLFARSQQAGEAGERADFDVGKIVHTVDLFGRDQRLQRHGATAHHIHRARQQRIPTRLYRVAPAAMLAGGLDLLGFVVASDQIAHDRTGQVAAGEIRDRVHVAAHTPAMTACGVSLRSTIGMNAKVSWPPAVAESRGLPLSSK